MSGRSMTVGRTLEMDRTDAVRSLVVAHLEASYNLARIILGDRSLAQEATHDAVVRALRSSRQLRELDAFEPWFRRILVNACRDSMRRRGTRPEPLPEHPASWVTPDHGVAQAERQAIALALSGLSMEHREVVVLRFYADLKVEEIAHSLGVRSGTVKSRLHRALRQLRAEYEAAGRPGKESRP